MLTLQIIISNGCASHLQYTEEIEQEFANTDISLSNVTLLNPQTESLIGNFSSKAAAFDSAPAIEQVDIMSGLQWVTVHSHCHYNYCNMIPCLSDR